MPVTTMPSLSEDGWITDADKMLDYLFSYYLLTDTQQSHLFKDEIISLPKTYFEYINNPSGMASAVRADLNRLLERYFTNVDISCFNKIAPDSSGMYYLFISASVIDKDGAKHEINKITQLREGRSLQVIKYNNYGDAYNDFSGI